MDLGYEHFARGTSSLRGTVGVIENRTSLDPPFMGIQTSVFPENSHFSQFDTKSSSDPTYLTSLRSVSIDNRIDGRLDTHEGGVQ